MGTLMDDSLDVYLDFAKETAYLAGKITLKYFQSETAVETKADGSPVTVADREAEEAIRSQIEARYPAHTIIGEEMGEKQGGEMGHRWFIDPIDGTKAFMRGVPLYSILLGLEINGTVEVGVAYFPALDEMISAASGLGCWWNDRRAYVSDASSLKDSYVIFTGVKHFEWFKREDAWKRLSNAAYYCAGWGDAYGYLLVATGRAEMMLDPIMNAWDCAPFPPILKEAGGYFGDWDGNTTIYAGEAMATTKQLLPEVLSLIKG